MAQIETVPLVVDLDGTVIRTDLMWESLAQLLRRNPLAIFQVLYWWARGRARLKQELGARVQVDAAGLPYHDRFLDWLRQEKKSGRQLVLATASDLQMVQPVVKYLGLFEEVLASDGRTNLRRENKRLALVGKFGERGFDYAGNSKDDLTVWRSARLAVVVNAAPKVQRAAAACATLGPSFCDGYSAHVIGRRFLGELFWRSGYLIAAAAGLLLASAFPKVGIAGFAWAAPGLLLAAGAGQSGAGRFRVGYVGGLVFWLASLYWLLLMPAPWYFVVLGWAALAGYVALYFGAWLWLAAPATQLNAATAAAAVPAGIAGPRSSVNPSIPQSLNPMALPSALSDAWGDRAIWALGGAAAWVALEMIRGWLFGGFPWSFLGVSQFQLLPLIQIASYTGVYGVSFLVVWFSLALYSGVVMLLRRPAERHTWHAEMLLPMLAVLACFIGGFFATNGGAPPKDFVRVTAIQPSVPQTLIWSASDDARRFQALLTQSQQALTNETQRADLLVWPESAVPELDEPTYRAIIQFAQSNHVWIILNAEDVELHPTATNYFNAAFLVGPDGRWRQAYHKRNLVIFGEYVPLANWLPFLKYLTPITGGWTPGDQPATFEMTRPAARLPAGVIQITADPTAGEPATINCAPLICFEDTFPGTTRDSARDEDDFLVNLTNDGWFGESAEQWQHAANSVFRAVENGLPLLRSANNGITCLIDRHGRFAQVLRNAANSEYAAGALTVDIPAEKSARTFYNRHGDWFGWGCVVVTAGMLLRRLLARKP